MYVRERERDVCIYIYMYIEIGIDIDIEIEGETEREREREGHRERERDRESIGACLTQRVPSKYRVSGRFSLATDWQCLLCCVQVSPIWAVRTLRVAQFAQRCADERKKLFRLSRGAYGISGRRV